MFKLYPTIRFTLPGYLLCITVSVILCGCNGPQRREQHPGEAWHMTDELEQANTDPQAVEAFIQAALNGNPEQLESLLKDGVGCNVADPDGHTALMLAAYNGHTEIVRFLIKHGAAINQKDLLDQTALHFGATGPFPETVRLLLENGADPDVVDSEEHFSPLMYAAAEGNMEVVKVLIEYGADTHLKDVDGDDAATFAARSGHLEVAEYLNLK